MTTKIWKEKPVFALFRNFFGIGNRGGREGEKSVNNTSHSKGERECIIGE